MRAIDADLFVEDLTKAANDMGADSALAAAVLIFIKMINERPTMDIGMYLSEEE